MMGMGLSGAIIPVAIGRVIELEGWRLGYLTLACIALAGTLPTVFLLKVAPRSVSTQGTAGRSADDGDDFATIRRNPLYWRLILTFGLMSVAFTGLVPYLVPMLRQYGMSVGGAASIASIMGLAVILSRLVIGLLIDILRPTAVAASLCLLCATGVVLFAVGGVGFAPVLAFTLGVHARRRAGHGGLLHVAVLRTRRLRKGLCRPPIWRSSSAAVSRPVGRCRGGPNRKLHRSPLRRRRADGAVRRRFLALPSPRRVTPAPSDTRPTPASVSADL